MAGHRIALVGDSFAFGTGVDVEETLGSRLDLGLGEGAVVENYALPGFGIDQRWMALRHAALPTRPALVEVAFVDADLERSLTAFRQVEGFAKPRFVLEDGRLRPQQATDRPPPLLRRLERHSAIFTAGRRATTRLGTWLPVGSWWTVNAALFEAIVAEVDRSGAELVLVRLPMKDWRPFPNLHALAERLDTNLIDLGDPSARPHQPLHFETDDHINAEGHRMAGEALEGWIRAELPQLAMGWRTDPEALPESEAEAGRPRPRLPRSHPGKADRWAPAPLDAPAAAEPPPRASEPPPASKQLLTD